MSLSVACKSTSVPVDHRVPFPLVRASIVGGSSSNGSMQVDNTRRTNKWNGFVGSELVGHGEEGVGAWGILSIWIVLNMLRWFFALVRTSRGSAERRDEELHGRCVRVQLNIFNCRDDHQHKKEMGKLFGPAVEETGLGLL